MKFVMCQDCLSPHQLPLAREIVKRIGADNFRYVYTDADLDDRKNLGWDNNVRETWAIHIGTQPELARDLIENAECLLTMFRDTDLIARRSAKGFKTFYDSERWFKPILINLKIPLSTYFLDLLSLPLPGWLKLLSPSYFKLSMRTAALFFKYPNFHYLPIGPHAARDMRLVCRIYSLLHLHLQPTPTFLPWGYFVEEGDKLRSRVEVEDMRDSALQLGLHNPTNTLRVLWVGRLLDWKRVDTIIRAIALLNSQRSTLYAQSLTLNPQPSPCSPRSPWQKTYTLTIVGDGPEKTHLQKLASAVNLNLQPKPITFHPSVPIHEVRLLMRSHDIYVLSSNAFEGWGAVVSEALSEGMTVLGTYEAGASAALLPDSQLFHSGNYKELARKLSALQLQLSTSTIPKDYTPAGAAERLLCKGEMNA